MAYSENILGILKSIPKGAYFSVTCLTYFKERGLAGWSKQQSLKLKNCGFYALSSVKEYRAKSGIAADTSKFKNEVSVAPHVWYNTHTGNTYLRVPLEHASSMGVQFFNPQGECMFTDKVEFAKYRAALGYSPKKPYKHGSGKACLTLSLDNIKSIRVGGKEYRF